MIDHKALWNTQVFSAIPEDILTNYLRDNIHGGRALDLGCGAGRNIPIMSEVFDEVLAIDISKPAIDTLWGNYKNLNNVRVVTADINEIDFPDNYFDVIVTNVALQHIDPDKIGFLSFKMKQWAKTIIMLESRQGEIPLSNGCYDNDYEKLFFVKEKIHLKDNTYLYIHKT